jgi:VanZ family protein
VQSLSRRLGLWGPVAGWMGFLFFVSSLSRPPGGSLLPDWITHPAGYAILAALVSRALAGGLRPAPARIALLAAAASALYGVTDEWHQTFTPGRDAGLADVVKNLCGSVLGAWGFRMAAARTAAPVEAAR